MESKIKVGVRIRPLNSKELEASSPSVIGSEASKFVITKPPAKKNCFEYDWSFDPASSNRDVYEKACRPLIENIFDGFNATFFAYGQTSSGKTHTLGGAEMNEGVIPFALQDIFARSQELHSMGTKVDIELTYIEIYREECFDLLSANGERAKLDLKETSTGKTALDGVTSQAVKDIESVMNFLREGAKVRSTGQTAMNAHSSRSHSICTLNLRVVRATTGAVVSQLHLVDLAGSERAKKTQATGDAFQEGISINRGLLALGNVVSALASRSSKTSGDAHTHVPYRESKLTRLLKDALGGNGMTVMLACVSPADTNFEETLNTLRFASRASAIVNSVRVNHSVGDATDTAALLKEISELREQVTLLQCNKNITGANIGHSANNKAVVISTTATGGALTVVSADDKIRAAEYHYMVSAALHITTALKTVLVTCLQEGSYVIDSDLLNIQAELAHIRRGLNLPARALSVATTKAAGSVVVKSEVEPQTESGDAQMMELDMAAMLQLPPIMTVIEEVRLLEKDLRAVEKSVRSAGAGTGSVHADGTSSSLAVSSAVSGASNGTGSTNRLSLGSDWSGEDSMLSDGAGADDAAEGGSACNASNNNNSFDQSFDSIAQDGDGHAAAFDIDCSFNDMDNMCMGDAIVEYLATQGGAAVAGPNSGSSKGAPAAAVKLSYVEEEAVRVASKGLFVKEAEVSRIAALTDKYQTSIKTLKAEIAALETDQEKLQTKQQQVQQQQVQRKPLSAVPGKPSTAPTSSTSSASNNTAASADELRIKRELKEKSKLLEEKIKLLRTKETEFGKISTQKARLIGEVDSMKKVVEDGKRKRADLQRKMRDEATVHRQESQQVKHSELQARRRELQAQQSVVRLEGQLQNKERVWKAQLESKERESKQLKELVGKQQTVKSMQLQSKGGAGNTAGNAGAAGYSSSVFAAAGALLTQQGSGLSTQEALNLKLWVDRELDTQAKRSTAQEALTREMLLRTKAAKALQAARQGSTDSSALNSAAALNTSIDSAASGLPSGMPSAVNATIMKALENELRSRSATIAGLNGTLTELGPASTADKKRFSKFTDIKESRLVSEVLFEVTCKAQKRETLATRRLRAVQDQLARCKKALAEANASVVHYQQAAERAKGYIFDDEDSFQAEMDETFYPSGDSDADASEASDDDDSYYRARPKNSRKKAGAAGNNGSNTSANSGTSGGNKRKVDLSETSMDLSAEVLPKKSRGGEKRVKQVKIQEIRRDSASEDHQQEQEHSSGDEGSSHGGSDSDGSSDSGSESDGEGRTKKAAKRKAPAAKKSAVDGAAAAKKPAKRANCVDPDFDDAEITHIADLSKHTISELKRFLAAKGLPVSGVKAELIKRLQAVLPTQEAHINGHTASTDVITVDLANNENNAMHVQENNMSVAVEVGTGKMVSLIDHSSSETAMVIDLVDI